MTAPLSDPANEHVTDTKPVEEAVQAWVQAWSARDKSALLTLWDSDDPDSTYLPAE